MRLASDHYNGTAVLPRVLQLEESTSLVGQIAQSLARDVIEGHLVPGADLNSVDLAKRFDTSRTPVREALILLQREGLVSVNARRRPRVAVLDAIRVEEIYRMRGELYAMVWRRVSERAGAVELSGLQADWDQMAQARRDGDVTRYFWANVSFHERGSEAAADQTMKKTLDSLGVQVLRLRHRSMSLPGRLDRSLGDHLTLLRACDERDTDLAAAIARSIVKSAYAAMQQAGVVHEQAVGAGT